MYDRYFVVAHFHHIMVGGVLMSYLVSYLGGRHYWRPKITGRMYPEWIAPFAAFVIFMGFNLTFFPQFLLGHRGMPRRYHASPEEFQVLNVMSSAAAPILAAGYVPPLFYLIWSLRYGKAAGPNPWQATELVWLTPSRRPRRTSSRRPWSSKRLTTTRTSNPRLSDHRPEDRSVQR